jgi:hypothetical protein
MALLSLISARNEYLSYQNTKSVDRLHTRASGFQALLIRKFSSPGLCAELQGWTYLVTACVCINRGQFIPALSFMFFSIGAWAGSAIANRGSLTTDYRITAIERLAQRCWYSFPRSFRTVLTDPGLAFALGNIPIFSQSLISSFNATEQNSLMLFGVLVGGILTLIAAIAGLRPLFTSGAETASSKASMLSAASNLILGSCILISALRITDLVGVFTGSAALFWGFGNIGYAQRIEQNSLGASTVKD